MTPRLARTHQQAVCYHLFNRGINRETLFHDETDFLRFCQILARCGRYIERNPVRGGLAAVAWDWRFSSAGFYAMGRLDVVADLTDLDPQYSPPGLDASQWAEYAAMLRDTADERWMAEQGGPAIGSAAFASRWLEQSGRPRVKGRRPLPRTVRVSV